MMMPIGYGSFIQKQLVVLIFPSHSSFAKRLIRKAGREGRLLDTTAGRRTRSLIVAVRDCQFFVTLSAFHPETLKWRFNKRHTRTGKGKNVLSYGEARDETSVQEPPIMVPIGYDSSIQKGTVIVILPPTSASAKRLVRRAKEEERLFDATAGRKTRSVIAALKDNCRPIILSAFQPETLKWRFSQKHTETPNDEDSLSYDRSPAGT